MVQPAAVPVTTEFYYRIKWGSMEEFVELYNRNHKPFMEEAQRRGLVTAIKYDVPYNHMAGGERWDWRVTITFRDAATAMLTDPAWDGVYTDVGKDLVKDEKKFQAEEARRFSLLEEHWDVTLMPGN